MSYSQQLIISAIPIVLPLLISLSAILYQHFLQRMPEQKRAIVEQIVRTVVPAIEQTATQTLTGSGKKQAAMEMATQMLAHLHISASQEMLSAMIEAAVFTLNQTKSTSPITASQPPLPVVKSDAPGS